MTLLAHTTSDRHSLARSLRVMAAAGTEVQLTMTSDQARALAADLDRLGARQWLRARLGSNWDE